jgi:hypothetical protein
MTMETVVILLQVFPDSFNFINNTEKSHSLQTITDLESNT